MDYPDATGLLAAQLPTTRAPAPWSLLRLEGPDSADYLQRMSTQDCAGMQPGQCLPAAFLNGKGKLLHTCLVGRVADGFVLASHRDQAADLAAHLEQFHFSEELRFVSLAELVCREELRAGSEPGGVDAAGLQLSCCRRGLVQELSFAASWPEQAGGEERFAALRILRGDPLVGVDTEPATIVLEAPVEDHIHFDKGCYTGQEIVARIRTYGHTNRGLCLLYLEGQGVVAGGTALCTAEDGEPVGRLMSAADLPAGQGRLGMGVLPNVLSDGSEALVLADTEVAVTVIPWG